MRIGIKTTTALSGILAASAAHLLPAAAFAQQAEPAVPAAQAESVQTDVQAESVQVAQAEPVQVAQAGPVLFAQTDTVDRVVVTARNVEENEQDVPISMTVVRGAEIERLQSNDIRDLTRLAANVSWNQGNQRSSSLSIRGVGKQGQTEAQDPSVGTIVDGVSYAYNALISSFDFTDIESIEVLRGPQGTLLGKNTSLGVINVTTRRPTFTPEFEGSVTYGERNTVIGRAAGGGPIVDDALAFRVSLNFQKADGWLVDPYNPDMTYQNKERMSGRVQFLYAPMDSNFSARLLVEVTPRAGEATNAVQINTPTPAFYSNGAPNTSLSNEARLRRPYFSSFDVDREYFYGGETGYYANPGSQRRPLITGSNGGSLELKWEDVHGFDITSISAYRDYHFNALNDEGTYFDVYRNSGGFWNDYRQISQEVRVNSSIGDLVDYQAGVYYIDVLNEADYRREWGSDAGAWFASNAQYGRLDVAANPDGSVSGGRYLMRNALEGVRMSYNSPAGIQTIRNKSLALFGQANWHLTDRLTLTTGLRVTDENRQNTTSALVKDYGAAPELNPVSVNGVELGGFASSPTTGALLAGNSAEQLTLADYTANRYFGTPVTAVPGAAYASLTPEQQRQVADAKAIRQNALGVLFYDTVAEPFEDIQYSAVVSPSYRFSDEFVGYLSWQYGEKAGISQTTNGISNLVEAEVNSSYEIGLKSVLLDGDLILNVDYFLSDIDNYQQGVRILDAYTTALNEAAGNPEIAYTTATGNVPQARTQGLEVDGLLDVIPNTVVRFSLAYTQAEYVSFPNSAQPSENGYPGAPAYRDVSGWTLPGSPELSGAISIDYRQPVFDDFEFHVSAAAMYQGETNTDNALGVYGFVDDHWTTDVSVGIGREDGAFDLSLLVKNAFDNDAPTSQSWNGYTVREPRWVGVVFSTSLW